MSGSAMNWDLDSIFSGGSASEAFESFRRRIARDIDSARTRLAELPRRLDETGVEAWGTYLGFLQDLLMRIDHADGFAGCLSAQNVSDEKAMGIVEEISSLRAAWQAIMTGVEELAISVEDEDWRRLRDHPRLRGARFFWDELRRIARQKMDPRLEKLAAELAVNGYHAWNRLYTRIAGDLRAEFTQDGKTERLSMGQLANKFNSPDRDIRRQAFEKLESAWKSVDGLAAIALNAQAGFRLDLYKNRGWDSPLHEPFLVGRLTRETVDAMWSAVADSTQRLSAYIDAKKRLLGLDAFRWHDQFAPVGASGRTYGYEEACDFVVRHLRSFSRDLGDFAAMAIERRWIEAEDRSGKAAGGFCTSLPVKQESRIFMTFSGAYDEMMTIAHELGHAYHNWVLRDREYLARQYPMNLAETASTFNELLVTDAALSAAADPAERLALLGKKLQEGFIMFCNIRARYLFDSMFYEERKRGTVSKERLNALMTEAQRTAFGPMLAEDGYHPLFWASKLHFFETEMPFYNFPYTFGYLFAGGIYDRAKKIGPAFAQQYRDLLADTGSMATEDLARRHLDVDLTRQTFWNEAVERVLKDLDPFLELAGSAR